MFESPLTIVSDFMISITYNSDREMISLPAVYGTDITKRLNFQRARSMPMGHKTIQNEAIT